MTHRSTNSHEHHAAYPRAHDVDRRPRDRRRPASRGQEGRDVRAHETFEDFLDFCPEAQHSLALRYRTVFDLIDTVGWDPDTVDPAKRRFKVALTEDLINLLGLRHEDLGRAVNDRIAEHQDPIPPQVREEITTDQLARAALDQLFRTWDRIAHVT